MSCFKVLCLLILLAIAGPGGAAGASVCGRLPPDKVAVQLAPCAAAARDARAAVSRNCCLKVQNVGRNPKCLCAVLLSGTAKAIGIKPGVAMTIPKRCHIANRPIGYRCGPYTLP